jgi:hypothetical protein
VKDCLEILRMPLSIIVDKGDPVDLRQHRHVALHLEHPSGTHKLLQVTGVPGHYEYECIPSKEMPSARPNFYKQIPVNVSTSVSWSILVTLIGTMGINNNDPRWNCQQWTRDSLKQLQLAGVVSPASYAVAIEQMDRVLHEVPEDNP